MTKIWGVFERRSDKDRGYVHEFLDAFTTEALAVDDAERRAKRIQTDSKMQTASSDARTFHWREITVYEKPRFG